jgi:hypothetical protein
MCGEAIDVPESDAYPPPGTDDRVLVPGAAMSGFVRPLPSSVTGPRLLNEAIDVVPVVSAPTTQLSA